VKIDIKKTAHLARVELTAEEEVTLAADLEKIVEYVDALAELDTTDVEPTSHVLNLEDVYRKDVVMETDAALKILDHLAEEKKHETFFKVPTVIEQ